MAKKEKVKNIVISNEELKPTTIGYLNGNHKSPIILIFIFAILIATVYYLPEISAYISKKQIDNIIEPTNTKENDFGIAKDYNEELIIKTRELNVSEISIVNNMINFKVESNIEKNLSLKDYYIELYDEEALIERIKLNDDIMASYGKRSFSYPTTRNEFQRIAINRFNLENIPEIELSNNNLICNLEKDSYDYNFANNKLISSTHLITTIKSDMSPEEYEQIKTYYQEQSKITTTDGITRSLEENEDLVYSISIDFDVHQSDDLEDEYFKKDELAKQIAYEMSLKGYKCK